MLKPFKGKFKMTQGFGQNLNKFYKKDGKKGHGGVDWAMPNGTPIYAPCDGEVIFTSDPESSKRTGWGVTILSDEIFKYKGKNVRMSCLHAHLKEGSLKVKRGNKVKQGELIALSNNTGQSTGPHLHFGIAPLKPDRTPAEPNNGYGGYIDPLPYLNGHIKALQGLLNEHGAKLLVDGKFGPKSKKALEEFLQ